MRRILALGAACVCCAVAGAQAPSVPENSVQFEKLRGTIRLLIAQKELAAAKAKAEVYSEEIVSYRQAAADARQSATEAKETTQAIVLIIPLAAALAILLVILKTTRENRQRIEADIEKGILERVDKLLSNTPAQPPDFKEDRASLLEGLRVLYYREAAEARNRGEWGSSVLFTVQALNAEWEAAELLGDPSRREYAQTAMESHGTVIRDHVADFERDAENGAWDARDLEQIRKLKRFATPDLLPTLVRLEQAAIESLNLPTSPS